MRPLVFRWLLPLLACAMAAPAAAQSIRGRVLDATTGRPVAEATVLLLAADGSVRERERTDDDGRFSVAVREEGTFRVRAERLGYHAATSAPLAGRLSDLVDVELRLSTSEVLIAPLTVTARRQPRRLASLDASGFYLRERAGGGGRFLRREDIERRRPMVVSDVLRGLPGVRMTRMGQNGMRHVTFSRHEMTSYANPVCLPRVYRDGAPLFVSFSEESLDDLVLPEELEAIEVYSGPATTPAQYGGASNACGVIVLWTRQGDEPLATTSETP